MRAGLEALSARAPDIVLVHDAARPFCSTELVSRAIVACGETGAAIPALEVTDTIKRVDAGGHVAGTIDRAQLRAVQTPQAFAFAALLEAHHRAAKEGRDDFTDDAALAEWAGIKVATFAGESGNVKLTTDEDFAKAEARRIASLADLRLGNGFDVHAFGDGDHVWLGGVKIPHDRGLTGHSDADVALHALVDAILGALADGDIGKHFSPNDPRWRGASSDQFLKFAVERVTKRGGKIAHLDLTIVCEEPRIGPHRDAMRKRIAEIAEMSIERVAVKATTSEQLGFTGRQEKASSRWRPPRCACPGPGDRILVMADRETEAAATALLDLCKAKKLMVATAESCTGGLVAGALTDIAGSSAVVDRGFVTYTNEAKHQMLGVPTDTLERHGAVSRETAEAMVRGALGHANADLAVSITGIAGPGGGTAEKPVGLVHFAAASRGGNGSSIASGALATSAAARCGGVRCWKRWRC